jgi:hypothetical protein
MRLPKLVRLEPTNDVRVRATGAQSPVFLTTWEASAVQRAWYSRFGWLRDRFPNYSALGPHNIFSRKE